MSALRGALGPLPATRRTRPALRRARRRQLLVDHFLEALEGLRAREHAAVDEEGRRPVDADALAVLHVLLDGGLTLLLVHAGVELRLIQSDLARDGLQLGRAQIA